MFHASRPSVLERMRLLEQIDARDWEDGSSRAKRLGQIPPARGKFLALLAVNAPGGVAGE